MKYGIITQIGPNIGTIVTDGGDKIRFGLNECPEADVGNEVTFEIEANDDGSYATDVKMLSVIQPVIVDLLARVTALERMLVKTTSTADLMRVFEEERDLSENEKL